jgi:MoaA/NifB/PqqE/SkfB family radical SAM enzyme
LSATTEFHTIELSSEFLSSFMNDVEAIASDAVAFRQAVEQGTAYKPLYVKIKIVWSCNLRCGMCNHWREGGEAPLDLDFFRRLVDDLASLGCRKIHLSGGEPTLRPNLEVIIRHIHDRGIRPTMTTNATLIDRDRAYSLAEAGLRKVNISLDSPDPAIHDQIRGVTGAWIKATAGFGYLRPWLRPGSMQINTVVNQLNYRSLVHLPQLAASLGADRLNLIAMDEHTDDLQRLTRDQIHVYNEDVAPAIAQEGMKLGLIEHPRQAYIFGQTATAIAQSRSGKYAQGYYDTHPCYAVWTHALIDRVGRVSVCCMLPNKPVIGDLRTTSFAEIWTGETFANLRRLHNLPLFEACRHCDMFIENNRKLDRLRFQPRWPLKLKQLLFPFDKT